MSCQIIAGNLWRLIFRLATNSIDAPMNAFAPRDRAINRSVFKNLKARPVWAAPKAGGPGCRWRGLYAEFHPPADGPAEAQQSMGLWPATPAVMVVAAKDPDYFSRTPAHYFAGMVEKAKQDSLRLDRSIWGLRTKAEVTLGKA